MILTTCIQWVQMAAESKQTDSTDNINKSEKTDKLGETHMRQIRRS